MDQKQSKNAKKAGRQQQAGAGAAANTQYETAGEFGTQDQANAATFQQAKQQAAQREQQKKNNS